MRCWCISPKGARCARPQPEFARAGWHRCRTSRCGRGFEILGSGRWLSEKLLERRNVGERDREWSAGYRVVLVDASTVNEPGSTGTDWRLHYGILLENLQCDHFEVTDVSGGETFRRFPVGPKDLLVGDRGYAHPPGIRHVVDRGAEALVRLNLRAVPLTTRGGGDFRLLARLRKLEVGAVGDWSAMVRGTKGSNVTPVRVCAVKKSNEAAESARRKIRRLASKKQHTVKAETLEAAGYIIVLATVPADELSAHKLLEIYRARWQIEIAFKRMKSIIGLGHLPKTDPESARAWLHGKLFVALLTETIVDEARSFSPWGYPLDR